MPAQVKDYDYPSVFGSHRSMVVKELEDGTVECQDEYGVYITESHRLDNGLSDPNRYKESRLKKLFEGRKREES